MGIANVIPGVSGGTIALITEIYEDLINSLKSFDKKSLHYIIHLKFNRFIQYTNLYFLITVFGGSIVSVFTIASLFEYLFINYPVLIWSFFFGLIIASIYFIGKRIRKWDYIIFTFLIIGIGIALYLSFLSPANENNNLFFVFLCGIIGISGMMLPGLSGSFILILMGNYELLMVKAVTNLNVTLLTIFLLGSVFGLITFSHMLAWLLKNHKNLILALLTGFILGSLRILWPWKEIAESIIIDNQEKIISYNWYFPSSLNIETILAFILILLGAISVYLLENIDIRNTK